MIKICGTDHNNTEPMMPYPLIFDDEPIEEASNTVGDLIRDGWTISGKKSTSLWLVGPGIGDTRQFSGQEVEIRQLHLVADEAVALGPYSTV